MASLSGRTPLRAALISVGVTIVSIILVGAAGWLSLISDQARQAEASAWAVGEISSVSDFQKGLTAYVVWTDDEDEERVTTFIIDDPSRWWEGKRMRLRYDPAEGAVTVQDFPNVVSGEEGIRAEGAATLFDHFWPLLAIGSWGTLFLAVWALRWWLNTATRRLPAQDRRIYVLYGAFRHGANSMVVLVPPDVELDEAELSTGRARHPEARWQRVMWTPGLKGIPQGSVVKAHIRSGLFKRAVVEPRPGLVLWPAGLLQTSAPGAGVYSPVPTYVTRTRLPWPPARMWLIPIPLGLLGAIRGDALVAAPLFFLGGIIMTVFIWASMGATPLEPGDR